MVSIKLLFVVGACLAMANGLTVSEFKQVGGPIYDAWVSSSPDNVPADGESFGLAHAGGKVYVVSRRGADASAVRGGIVSILDTSSGAWTHKPYDSLVAVDDQLAYKDDLLSLGGRVFMLVSSSTDAIRFHKLFVFDDAQGKWVEVKAEIDAASSQPLIRSKDKFVSINVPDQDGMIAYIGATDHQLNLNDSATALSKLEVAFENGQPISASLKLIKALTLPMASAIIATAAKDDKLHLFVAHFPADAGMGNVNVSVSLDKIIDLKTHEESAGPALSMTPVVDFSFERVVQLKHKILFLGRNQQVDDKYRRHLWRLDLASMQLEETDAFFPVVPNRIFAFSDKDMKIYSAGLKLGVFVADIA